MPALSGIPIMPSLLVMALLAWLTNMRKLPMPSQHILMPLLLASMTLSTAIEINGTYASDVFSRFYPVVILYFLIVDAMDHNQKFRGIFKVMVFSAAIMALHGIQQSIEGIGWTGMDTIQGRIRYIGIFADPNDLGLFFLTVIPMLIYLMNRSNFIVRIVYLLTLGIILYGIFLTQSRGTALGITALIGLFSVRRFGLIISMIIGVVALTVFMGINSRFAQIDPGEASAKGRVDAWEEGYYMTRDNPIFGVGVGGFVIHHYRTAHNTWVLAMAELGIPGYFIWNSLMIISLIMVIRLAIFELTKAPPLDDIHGSDQDEFIDDKKLSVTFLYSLTGFCLAMFFLSRSYNIFLYTMYALIVAHYINMKLKWRDFPEVSLSQHWGKILIFTLGSVIGFYFLAMILYAIG
jgi:O-antigen ligase